MSSKKIEKKEFFKDGLLKRKFYVDDKGLKQGKSIEYYRDGSIYYETNFKNDKEHGFMVTFNNDGSVSHTGHYLDGKRDGVWSVGAKEKYYINGKECEKDDLKSYLITKRFKK
jgi:antitoxin component YwqK of YwqJK toxin-antitoxin module